MPLCNAQPAGVTLSGVIDAGVRRDSGGIGRVNSLGSGLSQTSRLTFFGVEDLGDGLKASFALESGLNVDTGTGTSNPPAAPPLQGLTFGRTAAVALGSERHGFLSLGRQYTPLFAVSAGGINDPFGANWLGGVSTVYSLTARASNAVAYSWGYSARAMLGGAPRSGFGAAVMYGFSEESDPATRGAGRQWGFNLSWANGRWFMGYGYHEVRGNNPTINAVARTALTPVTRQQTLALSYEFGFGRLHLGLNRGSDGLALDRLNWHVGASLPLGDRHILRILYGRADDRFTTDADFSTWQIGYQYNLSRRTSLYAAWGQVNNSANSRATLAGALGSYHNGATARSTIAGFRHVF